MRFVLLNLYIIVFFVMFCPFYFFHCIICHSSIYTLWFSSFAHSIFFLPLYCLSFFNLRPLIYKLCTQYFLFSIVLSVILRFTSSDFQALHTIFSSCHCIVCPSSIYILWFSNFALSIFFLPLYYLSFDLHPLIYKLCLQYFVFWIPIALYFNCQLSSVYD